MSDQNTQNLSSAETEPLDIQDGISVAHPENALPPVDLTHLPQSMQDACARMGWTRLMPVQSLALPYLMDGRDIMIQSRTGSGKTGCYLLPMLPVLAGSEPGPRALVLVPTRELALQVENEALHLFEGTGISSVALYGGVGYKKQLDGLKSGAQLVIGTPGRILDHILRHSLDLSGIRILVFDEADRMLSIGFYPDMKEIQKYLPAHRIHTDLFSATYPPHVLNLAQEFMTDPSMLSLSQKEVYVAEVQHYYCAVDPMDKDRALIRIIEMENPASAIIFCNTKANVHYVCGVLQGFGYNADELSADLSQSHREAVMARVREGQVRFLVATDVAARGIDIPALSHVFLYEPPEDHESYIHRAGRTGRAGAAGTVISLVDIMERMELERIAKHYSISMMEMKNPTDGEVAAVVSNRLQTKLESRFRSLTGLERTRAKRYVAMARELAAQELEDESAGEGVNLLAMLLDAFHHDTLNMNFLPQPHESRRSKRQQQRHPRRGGSRQNAESAPAEGQDQQEGGARAAVQESGSDAPKRRRRRRSGRRRHGSRPGTEQGSSAEAPDTSSAPASAPREDGGNA